MLTDVKKFKLKFTLPYWLLVAVAMVAPLDQYQRNLLFGMSLQRIICIFLLGLYIIGILLEYRKVYLTPLILPLFLYSISQVVGAYQADESIAANAIIRTAGYIMLLFVAANLPKTRKQILLVMFFFMIGILFIEILAAFKMLTGKPLFGTNLIEIKRSIEYEQISRMSGTSQNPNEFAGLLVLALPSFLCFCFIYKNVLAKLLFLFTFVIGIGCLLATNSRSAMLGLLTGLFIVVMYFLKQKRSRRILGIFAICSALLLVTAFTQNTNLKHMNIFARILDKRYYDIKEDKRVQIWKESLKYIYANPFGAGIGKSAEKVEEYSNEIARARSAHNVLLSTGAECGWLGLASIFLMISFVLYYPRKWN